MWTGGDWPTVPNRYVCDLLRSKASVVGLSRKEALWLFLQESSNEGVN